VKEDFVLFEDGVPQSITFFGHEDILLSLLLLMEVPWFADDSHRDEIFQGVRAVLNRLRPEDEVALMSFNGKPRIIQEFTRDKNLVLTGLERLFFAPHLHNVEEGQISFLYTSIFEAARYMLEVTERGRRRVIVVFTFNVGEGVAPPPFGGKDRERRRMEREELERRLLERLYKSDIVISSVIVGNPRLRFLYKLIVSNEATVDKLVKITGGAIIRAKPGKPVNVDQLVRLIDHLRAQYVLGYIPAAETRAGEFRKLKIELSPSAKKKYKGVQLRHRHGYMAAGGEEGGAN